MEDLHDLREMERFNLRFPVTVQADDVMGPATLETETRDLSASGAFFYTDQTFAPGTKLKIELVLPIEELKKLKGRYAKVRLMGNVVRKGNDGIAVRFHKTYQILSVKE